MPDYTQELQNTTVVGMSGSGKTTLVISYLLNVAPEPACRFIFDDEGRTAPRLKLKPCYTLNELESSLPGRWSVFNPLRMFPPREGDRSLLDAKRRAFRWWCGWVFETCRSGPGVKIISIPEIWRLCTPDSIPPEFAMFTQMGRELGTHVICDTQRPELVNESVLGQTTELICFKLSPTAPEALRTVRKLAPHLPAIEKPEWPKGQFWSWNVLSGATFTGRVF